MHAGKTDSYCTVQYGSMLGWANSKCNTALRYGTICMITNIEWACQITPANEQKLANQPQLFSPWGRWTQTGCTSSCHAGTWRANFEWTALVIRWRPKCGKAERPCTWYERRFASYEVHICMHLVARHKALSRSAQLHLKASSLTLHRTI